MSGGAGVSSIFSISKSQISKRRVTKKFEKTVTTEKKRKHIEVEETKPDDLRDMKVKLDHRQYGVWYLHPRKWESRFQSLSDPKSIEIVKARRVPRGDKQASKQDVVSKKVNTMNPLRQENDSLRFSHSIL